MRLAGGGRSRQDRPRQDIVHDVAALRTDLERCKLDLKDARKEIRSLQQQGHRDEVRSLQHSMTAKFDTVREELRALDRDAHKFRAEIHHAKQGFLDEQMVELRNREHDMFQDLMKAVEKSEEALREEVHKNLETALQQHAKKLEEEVRRSLENALHDHSEKLEEETTSELERCSTKIKEGIAHNLTLVQSEMRFLLEKSQKSKQQELTDLVEASKEGILARFWELKDEVEVLSRQRAA